MIEIDGSYHEGGGQILRTALSLSAITGQAITIKNIRKNRQPSGLQPQHLMAAHSLSKICNGNLEGASLKSQKILFHPGPPAAGDYFFDVGTAGSAILVLQTLLPVLLRVNGPSFLTVVGGTHLPKSPNYDYFEHLFLPAIRRLGASAEVELERSGYYPRGGGKVLLSISPSKLYGCQDWDSEIKRYAIIRLGRLPSHIAQREQKVLHAAGITDVRIHEEFTFSCGNAITIVDGFRGASSLGRRGKSAENVAYEAIEEWEQEKQAVDGYLADQLLLYAIFATGRTVYSTTRFSDHFHTQLYVLSQFLDRKITLQNYQVVI